MIPQLVVKNNGRIYPIILLPRIDIDLKKRSIDIQGEYGDVKFQIFGTLFNSDKTELKTLKILSDVLDEIDKNNGQVLSSKLTWYVDIYTDEYDTEIQIRFEYSQEPYLFIFSLESIDVIGLENFKDKYLSTKFGVTFIVDELIAKTDTALTFMINDIELVSKNKVVIYSDDNYPNEKIILDFSKSTYGLSLANNLPKFVEDVRKMLMIGGKQCESFMVSLMQEKSATDLYTDSYELVVTYSFGEIQEYSFPYPEVKVISKKWRSYEIKSPISSYNKIQAKETNPNYPLSNYWVENKTFEVKLNCPLRLHETFTGSYITTMVDIQSVCYFEKENKIVFYTADTKFFSMLALTINNNSSYASEVITKKETIKILFDTLEEGSKRHPDFSIRLTTRLAENGKPITALTPLFGRNYDYGEYCFNCTVKYADEKPEWTTIRFGKQE